MPQTPPSRASEQPASGWVCSRLAFDGGNRFLKFFGPDGDVQIIQSCIKTLQDWEDIEPDEASILIETPTGRYVVGAQAAEMKGNSTHKGSKAKLARRLLPVALSPGETLIDVLVVATPDIRNQSAVNHLKRLAGTHQFKRNGEDVTVQINTVEVLEECRAAWRYASRRGGFRWPHMKNAVLDLGGGTALARVFTSSGTPIRAAEVKLPGTYDLAKKIASALQAKDEYSPDTSLIMDAIASGSFTIGQRTPFEGIFQQCRQQWIDEIRGALKEAWVSHMAELGEVLVIGGSAELARDFVESSNGRFKIPSDPSAQTISLHGMLEV